MGWGEEVASKEQTPPHVGNAHESEAAGVWWARPPTLHPLLAEKHASTMFISDSQLKVIVDVRLTGLFWSILTPIPIRHADVLGARKTSATAHLPCALARIISWGIQWSAKTHHITSPGVNACGGRVSRHWPLAHSVWTFFSFPFKGLPQTLRLRELLFQQDKFALVHQTLVWHGEDGVTSCFQTHCVQRLWFVREDKPKNKTTTNGRCERRGRTVRCLLMCVPRDSVEGLGPRE